MEYIYAALLLHKAGKKIDEKSVKKVVDAAGLKADEAKIKALLASLDGVDIEEAISKTPAIAVTASAPSIGETNATEEKKEEEEVEEITESAAAEGLGALFG
jgi:large subunit ribosomal protein L12